MDRRSFLSFPFASLIGLAVSKLPELPTPETDDHHMERRAIPSLPLTEEQKEKIRQEILEYYRGVQEGWVSINEFREHHGLKKL